MRTVQGAPSGRGQRIAVFGASGHTGQFVVRELASRGFTPVGIGRDAGKLASRNQGVETRIAAVEDPASLDRALAGARVVINCAGPFLDTAQALVEAALRAGIHYLDVTAEQASALAVFEQFAGPAQERGCVVVPAMGFYGGLADLLATAATRNWIATDEIRIGIALDSWRPTAGTRLTGKRNTARRFVIADGKFAPLADPAPVDTWEFPQPFGAQQVVELPFSEMVLIAQHLRVSNVHTYLNLLPLRDLRDAATPPPVPADETGRSAQTFLIEVIARKATSTRRVTVRGQDIYAVTAPLVVEAAQRILDGHVRVSGVVAPGQIFDADDFLRALTPRHLAIESLNGR